ncbi:hypothetical protein WJ66_00654 [Stenotrophomonas maltophilia WJ66]|nr:hypothetical protein WJ66_00654 [Stenotrophomonas maltophilia WJ66]
MMDSRDFVESRWARDRAKCGRFTFVD